MQERREGFIFWDAKRPITVELLDRLDLLALARELGTEATMSQYLSETPEPGKKRVSSRTGQGELFPA